jgi:excisionase family DNA binding protein
MEDGSKDLLRVEDAAKLWGVTDSTVYQWIREHRLTCFQPGPDGVLVAPRHAIRAARVMRPREVRGKGVDDDVLKRALRKKIVSSPDGRYCLSDVDAILGAANAVGPVRRQSGFAAKAFEWNEELEMAWVRRGAHPEQLPDGYFDVPGDPRFVQPANVFLYTAHGAVPDRPNARYVRRSAGYEQRDSELRWCEEDDRFDILDDGEPMKPEWAASSLAFRHAEQRMKRETYRRRRRRQRAN